MIKAIIFDCFGVLTVRDNWQEFWASMPTPDATKKARELNLSYNRAEISGQQLLEGLAGLMNKSTDEIRKLLDTENIKNNRVLSYIKELKQNYKIGLLSNIGDDWITEEFLDKEEQQLFDDMVISYKVGMTKPNPKIFELACRRLGVTAPKTVLVDDIDRYCAAAENFGMKTVLYENFTQMKKDLEKILNNSNN